MTSRNRTFAVSLVVSTLVVGTWVAYTAFMAHKAKPGIVAAIASPNKATLTIKEKHVVTSVSGETELSQEAAQALHQETEKLKAEGQYILVERKTAKSGAPIYIYEFTLANGLKHRVGSNQPFPYKTTSHAPTEAPQSQFP